jgi:hypothetical protein
MLARYSDESDAPTQPASDNQWGSHLELRSGGTGFIPVTSWRSDAQAVLPGAATSAQQKVQMAADDAHV